MKELASSFAQLAAIIMILITLAISTAALSQWAGAAEKSAPAKGATPRQSLAVNSR